MNRRVQLLRRRRAAAARRRARARVVTAAFRGRIERVAARPRKKPEATIHVRLNAAGEMQACREDGSILGGFGCKGMVARHFAEFVSKRMPQTGFRYGPVFLFVMRAAASMSKRTYTGGAWILFPAQGKFSGSDAQRDICRRARVVSDEMVAWTLRDLPLAVS